MFHKKKNYFYFIFLYFESEGWWLVNKKVTNKCYSPSTRNLDFFPFMYDGAVIRAVPGPMHEILGLVHGRFFILFYFLFSKCQNYLQ